MLLLPNKKKMASVIVASMTKKKPDFVQSLGEESKTDGFKVPEDEEYGPDVGLEASMDTLIKAIKAGDAKGAVQAMKDFLAQHSEPEASSEMVED